jgi:quinol monooxygenase YgiN
MRTKTCRVIADFTFKEGEISKQIEVVNGPDGLQVTAKRKGFIGIDLSIDMDNPNRMILTETWETREDHGEYMKFRESEGQDGLLAHLISSLAEEPKFSWSEVQGSW